MVILRDLEAFACCLVSKEIGAFWDITWALVNVVYLSRNMSQETFVSSIPSFFNEPMQFLGASGLLVNMR